MKRLVSALLILVLLAVGLSPVRADVKSKIIQETVEYAARKFGKEVASEGVERLTQKMTQLALKHGDDVVVAAVRKAGPRAAKVAVEAGQNGGTALRLLASHGDDALRIASKPSALRLVAQHGDDAATALVRHGTVGEKIVTQFGDTGAKALSQVGEQSGRRLAMLADNGALKPEMVDVVAKLGDRGCEFIWKNKGALAVGSTLAVFVASPEEFLDGTRDLVAVVGETAVRPLAELPKAVAVEAAQQLNWTLLTLVGGACCVAFFSLGKGKLGFCSRILARICGKLIAGRFSNSPKH